MTFHLISENSDLIEQSEGITEVIIRLILYKMLWLVIHPIADGLPAEMFQSGPMLQSKELLCQCG